MSLDWADALDEIAELSARAQLAYFKLIGHAWKRGTPIADVPQLVARLLNLQQRTWLKIRAEIAHLFDLSAGVWNHHQIARAAAHAERRAAKVDAKSEDKSQKVFDFPPRKPLETPEPPAHNYNEQEQESIDHRGVYRESARARAPHPRPPRSFSRTRFRNSRKEAEGTTVDTWVMSQADYDFARERGLDRENTGREIQIFADYYRARQTRFADWSSAWSAWVGRRPNFDRGANRGRREPQNVVGIIRDLMSEGDDPKFYWGVGVR
jgi:uncharacterized protein YdaU (DUF1376 family)